MQFSIILRSRQVLQTQPYLTLRKIVLVSSTEGILFEAKEQEKVITDKLSKPFADKWQLSIVRSLAINSGGSK